jgi:hypothetical protein
VSGQLDALAALTLRNNPAVLIGKLDFVSKALYICGKELDSKFSPNLNLGFHVVSIHYTNLTSWFTTVPLKWRRNIYRHLFFPNPSPS